MRKFLATLAILVLVGTGSEVVYVCCSSVAEPSSLDSRTVIGHRIDGNHNFQLVYKD